MAKAFHLVHFMFKSMYSINHLGTLITLHYIDHQQLVQKFIDKNWLSVQVFWVDKMIDLMYIHILRQK